MATVTTRSGIAALLALALTATVPAHAEMIGTPELLAPSAEAQRDRIQAILAREDVRRQLEAYGVDPARAAQRAAAMTPAEAELVSSRMDSLPAGAGLSTVELLLLLILIVLII